MNSPKECRKHVRKKLLNNDVNVKKATFTSEETLDFATISAAAVADALRGERAPLDEGSAGEGAFEGEAIAIFYNEILYNLCIQSAANRFLK